MKADDFEQQLGKQPFRSVPPEWREDILRAAESARPQRERAQVSGLAWWWRELLWPCPQAWAALAGAWLLLLLFHFANLESAAPASVQAEPGGVSRETLMAIQQQRLLRKELIQAEDLATPEMQSIPRPRTQNQMEKAHA